MTAEESAFDLCTIISDYPTTFVWEGGTYEGTAGPLITSERKVAGGLLEEPDFSITTCKHKVGALGKLENRFPTATLPAVGNALTSINGDANRNYRIMRITEDQTGVGLQFDCQTKSK